MTIAELRKDPEYSKCLEKVRSYPTGFEFTLQYSSIPKAKANALRIIMSDCIELGLLDSVSISLSLTGEETAITYRKI